MSNHADMAPESSSADLLSHDEVAELVPALLSDIHAVTRQVVRLRQRVDAIEAASVTAASSPAQ
ncbi:hypothetical protein AB0H12_09000 [Actinosynnema sp. NPDC023794]